MNISVDMCTTVFEATSCAVELQCTCLLNTHRLYSVHFRFEKHVCLAEWSSEHRTSLWFHGFNKMAVFRLRLLTQCNQYTATASMC